MTGVQTCALPISQADGPMHSPSGSLLATSLSLARYSNDTVLYNKTKAALNSGHALIQADPFWYATQVGAMVQAIQ